MPRILLIDDVRTMPATVICRTAKTGLHALEFMGPWDLLLLDHDLCDVEREWVPSEGDNPPKELSGSSIVDFLENRLDLMPEKVQLVTANPVGRQYMASVLDKIMFRRGDVWFRDPNPST